MKEEFYIGWQGNAPKGYAKQSKIFIICLIFIMIAFALAFALNQKKFVNSTFELDNYRKVKGILQTYPIPMLRVEGAKNTFQNFILVGLGKSGVQDMLSIVKIPLNELNQYEVTIEGEWIYYDGKGLMEVPLEKNDKLTFEKFEKKLPERKIEKLGKVELKGEIVDPKCFFGVMKPGFGKVHRACAIRCIAGGIPPVLAIQNKNGEAQYFILISEDGKPINQEIQDFVGRPIQLKGNLEKVEDWFVIRLNPKKDIQFNRDSKVKSMYE